MKSKIDLKVVLKDNFIVLGVVCEYWNRNFINFLLNEYNDLLGVGKKDLEFVVKDLNDDYIVVRIYEVLNYYNRDKVYVKVIEMLKKEGFNIRFERK